MTKEKIKDSASFTQEDPREYSQISDPDIRQKLKTEAQNFFYPNSAVYKNKYNITKSQEFSDACAHDAREAMERLRAAPLPKIIDSSYLKSLHQEIFSKTFEWAGQTREEPFTFADGTTASAPLLKKKGFKKLFAVGRDIQRGLQQLDEMLLEKGDLQDLTRDEFVEHASQVISHLYSLNPFREGNRRAIQLFVEKLGQKAGYELDYSCVSKKRKDLVRAEAVNNGDLEPIKHLLEDISNPESLSVLREFTTEMHDLGLGENNYFFTAAAREGYTYHGTYRGGGDNGFMMDVGNKILIIGNKKYLPPEQTKALKIGDRFSFTAPLAQEAKKVLIPAENVLDFTNQELSQKVYESPLVKDSLERIRSLCKIVYGKENIFQNKLPKFEIPMTREDFDQGEKFLRNMGESPRAVHRIRGFNMCGFKSNARKHAEENFLPLCHALVGYVRAIRDAQTYILEDHATKQERCKKSVEMPESVLRDLFFMSPKQQQRVLSSSPELKVEAQFYLMQLKERLSSSEWAAIDERHYRKLAESLGTSMSNAETISGIAKQTKAICDIIQQQRREMSEERDYGVYQSVIPHSSEKIAKIDAAPIKAEKIVAFAKQEKISEEKASSYKVEHAKIESRIEKFAKIDVAPTPQHKVGYVGWGSDNEEPIKGILSQTQEKRVAESTKQEKTGEEKIKPHKIVKFETQKERREEKVQKHKVGYVGWEGGSEKSAKEIPPQTQEKRREERIQQHRGRSMSI